MTRILHTVHDLSILLMTDHEETVAHRLIKARSGHGWSQADLAEVSGVAAAQISRYEAGRNKPRSEIVAKLAKALAVRFDWLAYGKGEIELEDGAEVEAHPSSKSVTLSFDVTPEMIEMTEAFAKERGITYEMAVNTLMKMALDRYRADPEAFAASMKRAEKL